jgi:hypothetical protein
MKWSMKYKKSINCKKPRGFSQKQHCKYRTKNGDKKLPASPVTGIFMQKKGVVPSAPQASPSS